MRPLLPTAIFLLALPRLAVAAPCGDRVHERRVPCRCGDTVVSDVRLQAGDPVVGARCPIDGLVVRAPRDAENLTIDLAGFTLRGSDAGVGLRVVDGGTDGVRILGGTEGRRGVVEGFGIGISAMRREAVARIEHLELRGNRNEGGLLSVAGTVLVDVEASRNGRDGLRVRGTGGRFAGVTTNENGENGLKLFSDNAAVEVSASRNARTGIIVDGADNDLEGAEAVGNGRDGIVMRGPGGDWEVARSEDNVRDDLRANGHRAESAEAPLPRSGRAPAGLAKRSREGAPSPPPAGPAVQAAPTQEEKKP